MNLLTLASQTGREIMNVSAVKSRVRSSPSFPYKEKGGIISCSRTCKTHSRKNKDTIIASHSNTEKVGGKIGYIWYWVFHRDC